MNGGVNHLAEQSSLDWYTILYQSSLDRYTISYRLNKYKVKNLYLLF